VQPSPGAVGSAYDNPMAECFVATAWRSPGSTRHTCRANQMHASPSYCEGFQTSRAFNTLAKAGSLVL
jgi:hypothetical protein